MVGGQRGGFARAKPLFELMGKNITLVGGNGDGQTTKVANQIIVALTIEAVAEALLFASKAGADPARVRAGADGRVCLLAHPRSAWRAHDQAHLRSGLPHRAAPEGPQSGAAGGKGAWHLAAQHGSDQELFNTCAANGDAGLDHSGLVKALERMANHAVA